LKGSSSGATTALQSIKGVGPNLLGHNALRQFMIKNKVQNYRGKSKREMLRMIVESKKNEGLDELMYSEDYAVMDDDNNVNASNDVAKEGTTEEGDSTSKKKPKRVSKLTKGSKPREISQDGSLYRIILVYFLQELRPFVNQLGTNPIAVQLGTPGFLHESTYNRLASVYNDSTREELKTFVVNHEIYVTSSVFKEAPATFDNLSGLAVSQAMDYINKHYRQARRYQTLSGNHKPFDHYCEGRPYLLLYHNSLAETGDRILSALAVPELPESVKRSSLKASSTATDHSVSAGKPISSSAEKKKRSSAVLDGLLEVSSSTCSALLVLKFINNSTFPFFS
jgi:hypothetical protein